MTPQQKGDWIRRLVTFTLVLGAAAGGMYFAMPQGWWQKITKPKPENLQVTKENITAVQASPGQLTITNMMVDGCADSEALRQLLEQLKNEKYGNQIVIVELDATQQPELAEEQGVDLEKFAGHLDFHADGTKLGDLIGHSDRETVEPTIDRMLAGMLRRIDKNWLPEVPGMVRDKGQKILEIKPLAPK